MQGYSRKKIPVFEGIPEERHANQTDGHPSFPSAWFLRVYTRVSAEMFPGQAPVRQTSLPIITTE